MATTTTLPSLPAHAPTAPTALPPAPSYATPPIHPKHSLNHILNSTLTSQRYNTRTQTRTRTRTQQLVSESTALTTTAATCGSSSISISISASASTSLRLSAAPRTTTFDNNNNNNYHALASASLPSQNIPTRMQTRARAYSNLSNASLPSTMTSAYRPSYHKRYHQNTTQSQSRRPTTRAGAASGTADENSSRAVSAASRSSKNAGLALRNRNTNVAASTVSSQKGGKLDNPSAVAVTRRRPALADSSNKVSSNNLAGLKGGKNDGKAERLVIVVEDNATTAAAAARPTLTRRTTRSSLGKGAEDGDVNMDVVEAEQRPIRSMRQSTSTAAGASSKPSSSCNTSAAGVVLNGRPTNIPRRSSTTTATLASTKNAGLKRSLKSSSVAPTEDGSIAGNGPELKKSTKNAGLRLKRELQALESDDLGTGGDAGDTSSSNGAADGDESKSARAARHERRRSKRLRHSDPEGNDANKSGEEAKDRAAAPLPSASTSRALDVRDEKAKKNVAAAVRRVINIEDDDEEEFEHVDEDNEELENTDDEDDGNMYELAKDAGWEDLDLGDEDDPLMVAEYVVEIHDYMKELELQTQADPHYMDRQSEVNWKMRSILVDWLIEVHGKFRLLPETIFLAVNIMDRLLSIRTVSLVKFQLVGIVSLQLASKYEEVVCPSVSSFLYMTDGCYTEDDLLAAERYVLKQIDFNLSYPNPINFLRRISKADNYDIQTRTVAKYFIEMSCVERKFLEYTPSLIAAAGMWLARKVLDRGYWNANLIHYSTYSQLELLPCAQLMLDYILRRSQAPGEPMEHPHFYKKYSAKKFYKAAEITRAWAERRYLVKRPGANMSTGSVTGHGAVTTLFTGLEGGGRLEEWEDEGEEVPEVDYE